VHPDPENEDHKGKTVQDMEIAKLDKYLDSQDKVTY
jgi:hypothetical protein